MRSNVHFNEEKSCITHPLDIIFRTRYLKNDLVELNKTELKKTTKIKQNNYLYIL